MFISYLLVFILAAVPLFELVGVIPLAIIGGLSPILVAILAFLGNLLTVIMLIVFVDKVRAWRRSRKQKHNEVREQDEVKIQNSEQHSKKEKRARGLFNKYGLPGLAIFGPLIVGSHIAAFMAMGFGSNRGLVLSWMLASLTLWTLIFTIGVSYGVASFIPDIEDNGFLIQLFK